MKITRQSFFSFPVKLFYILFGITVVSCGKPELVGLNVQPGSDLIGVSFTDSQLLSTYTTKEDSLKSDETSLNLLGSIADPDFGISEASFWAQYRLVSGGLDFGVSPRLDSAVVSFAYKGIYGDTNSQMTVRVYELLEDIYKDSTYYSNTTLMRGQQLGFKNFIPRINDSLMIGGSNVGPQLRVRLNDTFGYQLLNAGPVNLASTEAFIHYFKGINVAVDRISQPGKGSVMYFDLLSGYSALTLYFNDSLKYEFVVSPNSPRINKFSNDYSGTIAEQVLSDVNSGKNELLVQSMAGLKTKIMFPGFAENMGSGKATIHKAELIIPVKAGSVAQFTPPAKLSIARIDSLGVMKIMDEQALGESYLGGTYDESKMQYKFNIALYLQSLLSGEKDYGLFILPSGSAVNAGRAILFGSENTANRIRVHITYSGI